MYAIGVNTALSDRIYYQLIIELVVAKLTSLDVIMIYVFLTKGALGSAVSI